MSSADTLNPFICGATCHVVSKTSNCNNLSTTTTSIIQYPSTTSLSQLGGLISGPSPQDIVSTTHSRTANSSTTTNSSVLENNSIQQKQEELTHEPSPQGSPILAADATHITSQPLASDTTQSNAVVVKPHGADQKGIISTNTTPSSLAKQEQQEQSDKIPSAAQTPPSTTNNTQQCGVDDMDDDDDDDEEWCDEDWEEEDEDDYMDDEDNFDDEDDIDDGEQEEQEHEEQLNEVPNNENIIPHQTQIYSTIPTTQDGDCSDIVVNECDNCEKACYEDRNGFNTEENKTTKQMSITSPPSLPQQQQQHQQHPQYIPSQKHNIVMVDSKKVKQHQKLERMITKDLCTAATEILLDAVNKVIQYRKTYPDQCIDVGYEFLSATTHSFFVDFQLYNILKTRVQMLSYFQKDVIDSPKAYQQKPCPKTGRTVFSSLIPCVGDPVTNDPIIVSTRRDRYILHPPRPDFSLNAYRTCQFVLDQDATALLCFPPPSAYLDVVDLLFFHDETGWLDNKAEGVCSLIVDRHTAKIILNQGLTATYPNVFPVSEEDTVTELGFIKKRLIRFWHALLDYLFTCGIDVDILLDAPEYYCPSHLCRQYKQHLLLQQKKQQEEQEQYEFEQLQIALAEEEELLNTWENAIVLKEQMELEEKRKQEKIEQEKLKQQQLQLQQQQQQQQLYYEEDDEDYDYEEEEDQ